MSIYEKLGTLAPINKQAGLSICKGGESFDPKLRNASHIYHSHAPSKVEPYDRLKPHQKELIGKRFGRLTVFGYLGRINPKKGAVYVVKCDCGIYEHRKVASIKNPKNDSDACRECRRIESIKDRYARGATNA